MKKLIAAIVLTLCFSSIVFAEDFPEEKVADPTISKAVNDGIEWVNEKDVEGNEIVKYKLTGSLPSDWDKWQQYVYSFVDTMPVGQEYQDDIQVIFAGANGDEDITSKAEISFKNRVLSAEYKNLKDAVPSATANNKIIVYYSVKIAEDAPNDMVNYAHLEYENGTSVTVTATVHKADEKDTPKTTKKTSTGKKMSGTQKLAQMVKTGDYRLYLCTGLMTFMAMMFLGLVRNRRKGTS